MGASYRRWSKPNKTIAPLALLLDNGFNVEETFQGAFILIKTRAKRDLSCYNPRTRSLAFSDKASCSFPWHSGKRSLLEKCPVLWSKEGAEEGRKLVLTPGLSAPSQSLLVTHLSTSSSELQVLEARLVLGTLLGVKGNWSMVDPLATISVGRVVRIEPPGSLDESSACERLQTELVASVARLRELC